MQTVLETKDYCKGIKSYNGKERNYRNLSF